MRKRYKRVKCKDGFEMSVQASSSSYCEPKIDNADKYFTVEVGFPNEKEDMLMPWAENREEPTDTIYGWVPSNIVYLVITKHRGMIDGELPKGVPNPWTSPI